MGTHTPGRTAERNKAVLQARRIFTIFARQEGYSWNDIQRALDFNGGYKSVTGYMDWYKACDHAESEIVRAYLTAIRKELDITLPSRQIAPPDKDPARA